MLHVCVVIPARNEADELPETLRALAGQVDLGGKRLDHRTYEVIVLANNCSDGSAEVARRWSRDQGSGLALQVVERHWPEARAHVGTARRWLMDQACDRFEAVGRPRGLIASTDADTRVAPDWIAASLRELDAGADAVAGAIEVDGRELRRLGDRVRRAYWQDRVHRRLIVELEAILDPNPLDPYPRHDFHGGASLAITASMYRRVGGLPPLPSLEDVALAKALWREDARFVHSPRVRVQTSARQTGRALGGQSRTLARWSAEGVPVEVRDVREVEAEVRVRRRVRQIFAARGDRIETTWEPDPVEIEELSRAIDVAPEGLREAISRLPTFGRGLDAVVSLQAARSGRIEPPSMPIVEAITALRSRLRELSASANLL